MDKIIDRMREYWNVSPPMKGEGEEGTKRWSESITEHRHKVVPYLKKWLGAEKYRGKEVLDLGCGSGSDLLEYTKAGASAHGIDITDKAIEVTRRRLEAEEVEPSGVITTYDGMKIPFADESFDLVYSGGVLHHTPYMDDLLAEIYRVLVPGGHFKAMVYNKDSLLYYYSILLRRYREGLTISRDEALSRWSEFRTGCPYTRVYTEEELEEKLRYFTNIYVHPEYLVYDEPGDRKLDGEKLFDIDKTGIIDIDRFFEKFNNLVRRKERYKKDYKNIDLGHRYGWHLLIDTWK